ncbi:MAG TPA: hypothetical protein VEC15_11855, partial [Actinomycetota bacterium]|nr:hypothetical protein [Actinomycetota bacterium]
LLAAVGDTSGAATTYRHAIDIAHQAGARMTELQATIGLAEVTEGRERNVVVEQLARLSAGFTEGSDAPDVVAAREMFAG